jgi:epoxyqueuosine reductase QueG
MSDNGKGEQELDALARKFDQALGAAEHAPTEFAPQPQPQADPWAGWEAWMASHIDSFRAELKTVAFPKFIETVVYRMNLREKRVRDLINALREEFRVELKKTRRQLRAQFRAELRRGK